MQNKGIFDNLCQNYKTWIIQYNSSGIGFPIYMVWLTDTTDNDTDKLILNDSEEVIASKSPEKLLKYLEQSHLTLPDAEITRKWLLRSIGIPVFPFASYGIDLIREGLETRRTTKKWFAEIANFISLYRDYGHQVQNNAWLELSNTSELMKVWTYYYEDIFWEEFDPDENFNEDNFFIYQADFDKLTQEFNDLIEVFESSIEII